MVGRHTIASALWGVCVTLAAAGAALLLAAWGTNVPDSFGFPGFAALLALSFGTVGALIVWSRANLVGWLLLAAGVLSGVQVLAEGWAVYGILARPGSLAGATTMAWLASWIWVFYVPLVLIFVPLVYPTGRLPSAGWRPVVGVMALTNGAMALGVAIASGPLSLPYVENPFGAAPWTLMSVFIVMTAPAIAFGAAVGISLVLRFRAARGIERQQIKWFAYGVGLLGLGLVAGTQQSKVAQLLNIGAMLLVPLFVGLAILRYRLYDIDLLINRTLVYGVVTGILLATYLAAVVVIQTVLRPFTSGNELAVAGSTLFVVALFQPVRQRIQGFVDRRFYRSRYDAARTLDAFGERLRNEVDLDSVRADLLDAVRDTLRPTEASLWLRQARR